MPRKGFGILRITCLWNYTLSIYHYVHKQLIRNIPNPFRGTHCIIMRANFNISFILLHLQRMHNCYKAVISKKKMKWDETFRSFPNSGQMGRGAGVFRSMPGINGGGDGYILCEWNNCMVVISCGCIIIDSCNSVSWKSESWHIYRVAIMYGYKKNSGKPAAPPMEYSVSP